MTNYPLPTVPTLSSLLPLAWNLNLPTGAKLQRSVRRVALSLPKAPGVWPAEAAAPEQLLLPGPFEWETLQGLAPGLEGAAEMDLSSMFPHEHVLQQVGAWTWMIPMGDGCLGY